MTVAVATTAYRRRPRSSAPGTWSRQRVVEAIRDWTVTYGEPPRSYEWTPHGRDDLPHDRRWASRYPRWPSASTVCLIFGTWNDALRAAETRVHREVQLGRGRAARVEAARRLDRQGLRTREIATAIGVSPQTVRRYLRSSPCRTCGEPVIGDGLPLCASCTARSHRRPQWSREEILEAIHTWSAECGHAPRQGDWESSTDPASKWAREYPRWPSAQTVRTVFGRWSEGLRAAGFAPQRRNWDAEAIVAALGAWARVHGRAPTKSELDAPGGGLPTSASVLRHLGSHEAALRAAGLTPHRRRFSDEEILRLLADAARERGAFPTTREWPGAAAGLPHEATVRQRFGSWAVACARAAALG